MSADLRRIVRRRVDNARRQTQEASRDSPRSSARAELADPRPVRPSVVVGSSAQPAVIVRQVVHHALRRYRNGARARSCTKQVSSAQSHRHLAKRISGLHWSNLPRGSRGSAIVLRGGAHRGGEKRLPAPFEVIVGMDNVGQSYYRLAAATSASMFVSSGVFVGGRTVDETNCRRLLDAGRPSSDRRRRRRANNATIATRPAIGVVAAAGALETIGSCNRPEQTIHHRPLIPSRVFDSPHRPITDRSAAVVLRPTRCSCFCTPRPTAMSARRRALVGRGKRDDGRLEAGESFALCAGWGTGANKMRSRTRTLVCQLRSAAHKGGSLPSARSCSGRP